MADAEPPPCPMRLAAGADAVTFSSARGSRSLSPNDAASGRKTALIGKRRKFVVRLTSRNPGLG
jgi:hypothetical protein